MDVAALALALVSLGVSLYLLFRRAAITKALRPRWWLGIVVAGLVAASIGFTLYAGDTNPLPASALGSLVLLHLERAMAIFLVGLFVFVAVYRGLLGQVPSAFGREGVTYTEVAADTARVLEGLRRQIDNAEAKITALNLALVDEKVARIEHERKTGH
jgi:hypothetical protein